MLYSDFFFISDSNLTTLGLLLSLHHGEKEKKLSTC